MQAQLMSALRARAIAISDASVEAALRDADTGPALAAWAQTYATADTLLSADELEQYAALADDDDTADDDDNETSLPVSDGELRAAAAALDRSTAMLRKQADVLRQQEEALAQLQPGPPHDIDAHDGETGSTRAVFEARRRRHWDVRRGDVAAAVEGLGRGLGVRADELVQQNRELAGRVQQTVDALCRSDDTLLASLQKLGRALPVALPMTGTGGAEHDDEEKREAEAIEKLRDACTRLVAATVDAQRVRLDRLFLETLESAQAQYTDTFTNANDSEALQDELESLYGEMQAVAQMAAEQQYLAPALASVSGRNGQNLARSVCALDYIDECLDYLLEHIGLLTTRIETAAAHYAAAETLAAAARAELAVPVPVSVSVSVPMAAVSPVRSPARRDHVRGHVRAMSAVTPGTTPPPASDTRRRRSSGFGSGLVMGARDTLVERVSLLLPDDANDADDADGNVREAHAVLRARTHKGDAAAASAQEAYEAATAQHVADTRRAVARVRASLLGDTAFGPAGLEDREIDASVRVVADEVARVRAHQASVARAADVLRKHGSTRRAQLVARWRDV